MLEITSTPLVIIGILGTVGILLPIISIARKEQGSNTFYAIIAFAALIVSMGYVAVSYTHLRAHETKANLVCRLLLEKKKYN